MKSKTLFIILINLIIIRAFAQENSIDLDVLRAPSSPASNLLGIANTDIDKPTDISSFMLSLQSASNSFTQLPSNYAVDIAPFLLFKDKSTQRTDFTTNGLESKKPKDIFKQTFVVSMAVVNSDNTNTNTTLNSESTYVGFGFKFSICRGNYSDTTKTELKKIVGFQKLINDINISSVKKYLEENNEEYQALDKEIKKLLKPGLTKIEYDRIQKGSEYKKLEQKMSDMLKSFYEKYEKSKKSELKNEIKTMASSFQIERTGFSWDINGGISTEFRDKSFSNSKVYNLGLWTNFGFTTKKGFALLGLARYLYNPDKIFALDNQINDIDNIATFDAGARLAYSKPQSKFSFSFESIYRSVLSSDTIDPSWKMILNTDYSLLKNQKLTFSFGRDFDGTISKDGNLIAALSFIAGFGNK